MNKSTSFLAFPDVKIAFERALASERGIKVAFTSRRQAIRFAGRCNSYRVLDRKENAKIYAELTTHQLHGRSVFDHLSVQLRDNDVHIIPIKLDESKITEL